MKILVTGAHGLLGSEIAMLADARGLEIDARDRSALDVTVPEHVRTALMEARPDVVIQCAAYSRVDAAEEEPELAWRVNRDGARNVADAAAEVGARFVYVSSDYVFDGRQRVPYRPDAQTRPLSVYGATKAGGEEVTLASDPSALVVRTSWLFGSTRPTFVSIMVERARSGEELVIVDDQVGSPSWARDVADGMLDLVARGAAGIRHVSSRGSCSWADLAREALRLEGASATVRGVTAAEWGAPARRPAYSVLDVSETEQEIGRSLPAWRDALGRWLGSRA